MGEKDAGSHRDRPLKVIVLGAGALGSLFGGLLSKKHDVVLVGRKQHVQAINSKGLQITGVTMLRSRPKAVTSVKGLKAPDILIIAVKAYDTEKAVRQALPLVGKDTKVMSFQNGITTVDVLEGLMPKGSLLGGWTSHGVTFVKPGVVKHAGVGDTVVGELDGRRSYCTAAMSHVLTSCGIETKVSSDIRREVWLKGIVNSSINPITAILRCENGALVKDARLSEVVRSICAEASEVAKAEGHDISEDEAYGLAMRIARQTSANRSSMLQDVEQGRETEVDFLSGAICELGSRHGIETPVNAAMLALVKSL